MTTRLTMVAILMLATGAARAADAPLTIGELTRNNGLAEDGRLVVRTPGILRVTMSPRPAPDAKTAIAHYAAAAALASDPELRAEALRRSADLRLQLADADGGARDGADPAALDAAIGAYRALLVEQPEHVRADRVRYQLARALSLRGEEEPSIAMLLELGHRHPDSPRAPDALFRAGELLYRAQRYAEAEPAYRALLALGPGAPLFGPAQYKLGWTLFQQGRNADAVRVFLAVLERELPPGEQADPLALVRLPRTDLVTEALRVTGVALMALGGGRALGSVLADAREPRFIALLHAALGAQMIERRRYHDAAEAYTAFIERHPQHVLAPAFQRRVIEAYAQGGFGQRVAAAKEVFVRRFAPGSAYWSGRKPDAEVMTALRADLEDLGRAAQARAQLMPVQPAAARSTAFASAAEWYRQWLETFSSDAQRSAIVMLYADALYDAGQLADAAREYEQIAYAGTPAAEPAYAAVQTLQRMAREAMPAARSAALRHSAEASLRFAERLPADTRRLAVLADAASALYAAGDLQAAIATAARVLAAAPPAATALRHDALALSGDAHFTLAQYADAERAYAELATLPSPDAVARAALAEKLAVTIYRQGEAARSAGDLRTAATQFLRVGAVAHVAARGTIRASADYDAAAALIALRDWPAAASALEGFRERFATHRLIGDADKLLAQAYDEDRKPAAAASAYLRVAARESEGATLRADAAWRAAQLYDSVSLSAPAARAYEGYLAQAGADFERGLDARRRLADLAQTVEPARYPHWLAEIVAADDGAGRRRSERSRACAAQASLELGRAGAARARAIALSAPLGKSLPRRKAAADEAIRTLVRAGNYGFAEVTTAATFELGALYQDLGRALLTSERPRELDGEALEQYQLLVEEQAFPFEEKAIALFEANLQRLRQGLWDEWISRSASALSELAPGRYGKREHREQSYDRIF